MGPSDLTDPENPGLERAAREVAVAIVLDRGEVLVGRRPSNVHLGGHDEFPGGHRLEGEDLPECARREVREETGLEVVPVSLLCRSFHGDSVRRVWLWFYECGLRGDRRDLACSRVEGWRWVSLRRLQDLNFPPANRRVLDLLAMRA